MNDLSRRCIIQVIITAIFGGLPVAAGDSTQNAIRVALSGYDPVAYFTDGHPVKGSSAFSFQLDDVVYYFASAEHRKMLASDPDRYTPHFSGYCTLGVSLGMKLEADPEAWAIADGKLYVFGNKQSRVVYDNDPAGTISRAEANWATVKNQKLEVEKVGN